MLKGPFIFVKSSVWLITNVICVFVPILMREVSVIDKRYSNTNTSLPPPQSACQCTRINLQPQPTISLQSHFSPNWSLKSYRMFVRILVDHQSLSFSLSFWFWYYIDNSPRIQDIKKVIGCIFVIFFSDSLFLSGAGILDPCAKGDDRLMNCRYKVQECTAAHRYIQPADLELIINRQWRNTKLFSTLGILFWKILAIWKLNLCNYRVCKNHQ